MGGPSRFTSCNQHHLHCGTRAPGGWGACICLCVHICVRLCVRAEACGCAQAKLMLFDLTTRLFLLSCCLNAMQIRGGSRSSWVTTKLVFKTFVKMF